MVNNTELTRENSHFIIFIYNLQIWGQKFNMNIEEGMCIAILSSLSNKHGKIKDTLACLNDICPHHACQTEIVLHIYEPWHG